MRPSVGSVNTIVCKLYKNKLTTILRNAEKMNNNIILDDQKQNSREAWKILNTIINKRQNESSYTDSFITGGITVSKKNDIADGFNHFFANSGYELAAKIDPPYIKW